ncbi:MAG: hypothetical protein NWS46_07255 [Cyclobacteriaceae bacterium]|nr:hypothetical protein [Cyclobacteriaceae bacterium]
MDHIKKISGQYIFDDQNIETSIKLDLNKDFFLPDENGINMSVSIHRLVDKINVIDVSNYFYEVSIKKEGQENLNTMNTMQVIHNSSNDQVLIDIAD